MRIFLSFNARDCALAAGVRTQLLALHPEAEIFFSPESLGHGLWAPKLGDGIEAADGFLLVLGPNGAGPWQAIEFYEAFDRHVRDPAFAVVPLIMANARVPGLRFLRQLNWIELPGTPDDSDSRRIWSLLNGDDAVAGFAHRQLVHPYRGLEAMTEAEADYFFGREAETAAVLSLLAEKPHRLPLLIGASGVGKSSIARAGVLSALKTMRLPVADGAAPAAWPDALRSSRRNWAWLVVRPLDDPMLALAAAFTRLWLPATDPELGPFTRKWAEGLRTRNTLSDLVGAAHAALEERDGVAPERILVYLDQGEELYTRSSPRDAARFSALLAEGVGDQRLVAFGSLRADYFASLQADADLFAVYEHVNAPPLTRERLRRVVTGPPASLGITFENEGLPARIVEDAAAQPGTLPLLSYLLTDMWSAMLQRGDNVLRLPGDAVGLGGVLVKRAEKFLKINLVDEAPLKRLLTLRLALVPAEGMPVRRTTRRAECAAEEWRLAERLAEHPWRLTVIGERETDGEVRAEIAHEALLHAWPLLATWLRDERDFLMFKADVERAERRWREMGRDDKALLTGLDLNRAEEWQPKRGDDLSAEVRDFVGASIALDRAVKTRVLRYQRRVSTGAAIAALILAAAGGMAFLKWHDAEVQTRHAADATEIVQILLSADRLQNLGKSSRSLEELDSELFTQFSKAGMKGNVLAERAAGLFAFSGRGVPRDYAQAREWWERAAAKGDAGATRLLGILYGSGLGVPANYSKAFELFKIAAARGDAFAMVNIGRFYAVGLGVPQNYAMARNWYEKAAAKNVADALLLLGVMYDEGQGVQQDTAKAREWYAKAENASYGDYANTMTSIGQQYEYGQSVQQNYARAREWYEKAAAKDNANAMRNIGVFYENGQGVVQDYGKAREWFEKAAAKGDAYALNELGDFYKNGQGVAQDYVKAREQYEKAAAKDNIYAMNALGQLYEDGQGVAQDYVKAREWYEKSAAQNNPYAMNAIGLLYENGQGVAQDYAKAREWYEKAAAKGDADAMEYIGDFYKTGQGVAQDYVKAREWYEKAAAKGSDDAMANIAALYADGHGVPQDQVKALEWQERAAAAIELGESKETGKPGSKTADALVNVAWQALLAREPARALAAAERAQSLTPGRLRIETIRAHALMFLDRSAEARRLYLSAPYKTVAESDNKAWQQVIAENFGELRRAGLNHPMMAEIESALKRTRQEPGGLTRVRTGAGQRVRP